MVERAIWFTCVRLSLHVWWDFISNYTFLLSSYPENVVLQIKVWKVPRFSLCSICEQLCPTLDECAWSRLDRTESTIENRSHIEMIAQETCLPPSKGYEMRKPSSDCSIIVQGAEQWAFRLPHSTRPTEKAPAQSLQFCAVGVLKHYAVKRKL